VRCRPIFPDGTASGRGGPTPCGTPCPFARFQSSYFSHVSQHRGNYAVSSIQTGVEQYHVQVWAYVEAVKLNRDFVTSLSRTLSSPLQKRVPLWRSRKQSLSLVYDREDLTVRYAFRRSRRSSFASGESSSSTLVPVKHHKVAKSNAEVSQREQRRQ